MKTVLAANPVYGQSVQGTAGLRKMRVGVPNARLSKSSGYRLIYRQIVYEEQVHVILMDVYFKSEKEDLSASEYQALVEESEHILDNVDNFAWDD